MPEQALTEPADVGAVRRFNRFYTRRIGVLDAGLLQTDFSLPEARLLYELAHRERPAARDLVRDLGLDAGYASRLLKGLVRRQLVTREPSTTDRRQSLLQLTAKGRRAAATLDRRSRAEVAGLIAPLTQDDRRRLVSALTTVESLLAPRAAASATPYVIRSPRPGDYGWIIHRHGAIYASEYGWDERFEGLVAGVVAEFIARYDPRADRAWVAERDGAILGSIFLVRKSKTVAKLRLLLVEPSARGLGIGRRLVNECILTARALGYRRMTLWTNSHLDAARHIYEQTGFALVHSAPHDHFGEGLIGETWELDLTTAAPPGAPAGA